MTKSCQPPQGGPDWAFRMSRAAASRRPRQQTSPETVSLLEKAETLKTSVEAEDARDIESLCESLKNAMAAGDPAAVAELSAELDDLLFYIG